MKKIFLFISISFLLISCNKQLDVDASQKHDAAQNKKLDLPELNKLYGGSGEDYLRTVIPGNNGGYVFTGDTYSIDNIENSPGVWIVKVDESGNKVWEKIYGGSSNEMAYSISSCGGGYIVVGSTYSTDGDIPAIHGDGDCFVLKIDEEGNMVSQKSFGGAGFDELVKVIPDADGNFIMVGHTQSIDGDFSTNHGASDLLVIKIDGSLNVLWQQIFGGSGSESGTSAVIRKDGGYIITGTTDSNDGDVKYNHGGIDFWAVSVSDDGRMIWEKAYGGTGFEFGSSATGTVDGGCLITGLTTSSDGDISTRKGGFVDGWLIKIDKHGAVNWDKTVGGTGFEQCLFSMTTHNGDYLIGGNTTSNDGDIVGNKGAVDGWTMWIDKQGKEKWVKVMGGSSADLFYSACEGPKGNYVIAGHSDSNDGDVSGNHGFTDAWLFKVQDK